MASVTHFRILAAALLMTSLYSACAEERKAGIEIGIAPFLPVKTLVQNYAPLCNFLQSRLNVPVTIVSAPDYKTYYKFVQNRDYQIIITTASSAYLAWADHAYVPLLQPLNFTHPAVVVLSTRELRQLSDLRGKVVAMSDATAIVSMQGLQMLQEAGLEPERSVKIINMQNHSAAVNHVITGEVDAAIVSDRAIAQMPASIREQIKLAYVWEKGAAPGIVYMGSPDMPLKRLEQINKAIIEFARDTPEGVKLLNDMGYGGLKPIGAEELRLLEPYGAMLKKALTKTP